MASLLDLDRIDLIARVEKAETERDCYLEQLTRLEETRNKQVVLIAWADRLLHDVEGTEQWREERAKWLAERLAENPCRVR
jgi:hypothetical protein